MGGGCDTGARGGEAVQARRGSLAIIWLLIAATPAHAYLDPSTGSMILSAIVGLIATLSLALKTYWYRLRGLFRRRDERRPGPGERGGGEAAGR